MVRLEPLTEEHFAELEKLGRDLRIWEYLKHEGLNKNNNVEMLQDALLKKDKGLHYPFTIFEIATGKIIGTTRFWRLDEANKKLEIGWTWIGAEFWGRGCNMEAKMLLLNYCFETLKAIKVKMVASEDNIISRKAIEKTGALFEGVLRKERICADGIARGFAYYGITDDDWPLIKSGL